MPEECYDKGQLLGKQGKEGWPDEPLAQCKPDETVKLKCMTVKVDDFYSIKADNIKCHQDLISCQQGPLPKPSP